ncbi:MAG: GTP-binding protein, partial [Coriobacteriales bacterium]|nr:GTP-binding protein [Coriobacteriales bacterium]
TLRSLVIERHVFPCVFGSALRMEGVDELLALLSALAESRSWPQEFSAQVYKVSHGRSHERICWLKVTGGVLRAKSQLVGVTAAGAPWQDKVDQLRVYQGSRFEVVQEVPAGQVCAATGLSHVYPGDGLGEAAQAKAPALAPVLDYTVLPQDCDVHAVYEALRELAEEDPLLGVSWSEHLQEIRLRLMGAVQLEVVQERLQAEHGLAVGFGPGSILYKETISDSVEGIGHFEPLRHYAEVHLQLEPLPRGAGVEFGTVCLEDDLDRNWQRLILTNAAEREHCGVLTGAPLTDVRITLLAGRAHPKHTEGGDFRQATYRAIRQGLMQAQSVLLEPWYHYELEVPADRVGRALADLQRMAASFETPEISGEEARISGEAPVSEMRDYALQVSAYTGGHGRLFLELAGYRECHDADKIIEAAAYDPVADLPNTPDSVFCSHGAGYNVRWDEVAEHAHVVVDPARCRPWVRADAAFFASSS